MIFLSYSRTPVEQELVAALERTLAAAGFEVWRDVHRIQPGDRFRAEIEEAIRASSWIVFLVSNSWLDSPECQNELALALRHHGHADRFVPLLRAPFERLRPRIPVPFQALNLVEWTETESDPWARLAELVDKMAGTREPAATRSERGRALAARAGVELGGVRPDQSPHAAENPPSFHCDRARQWATIEELMGSGRNELVVVRGPAGEYHEHFLQRVERTLPDTWPRTIVPVRWRRRPVGQDDYLRALAGNLDAEVSRLARAMNERLAHRHLVLVHECIDSDFDDDDLEQYYADWLPGLIADARGTHQVKCVQAIKWPRGTLLQKVFGWRGSGDDRSAAEELVARVGRAARGLRVVRLRELEHITIDEVRDFCEAWVEVEYQEGLLEEVRKERRSSEEILRVIDKYLHRVRRHDEQPAVVATLQG